MNTYCSTGSVVYQTSLLGTDETADPFAPTPTFQVREGDGAEAGGHGQGDGVEPGALEDVADVVPVTLLSRPSPKVQ